tara:strand:- start:729 stop:1529 length:801 start_codon:yes stop_codon:yes gene_type:complete
MPSALLNVMIKAAKKASIKIRRDFNELENLQVSLKGPGDFVTSADIRTQKIIIEELIKAKPDWSFLAEEKSDQTSQQSKNRFIIDPIDGTTNFLHGNPNFAISIAAEIEGRLEAGIVYCPIYDELFFAERGKGAYLNDRRLRIAKRNRLSEALVVTGIPHLGRGNIEKFINEIKQIMPEVSGIRRSGSAALDIAWVAAGRYDAYWEKGLSLWDIAAGIVIIREAGGVITGFDGDESDLFNGNVIAGNDNIHEALLKKIKNIYLQDD